MEKAKFFEAATQNLIVDLCNDIITSFKENVYPIHCLEKLFACDKKVKRSFLRWVENEKTIAEQKFKEI